MVGLSTGSTSVGEAGRGAGLRLLFIGGAWRSGSTLLDLMLGQHPGVFAAGELREIWRRGLIENGHCGCRLPFRDCPFWRRVGESAFGGWKNLDIQALVGMRQRLDRPSSITAGLRRSGSGGARAGHGTNQTDRDRYVSTLQALLEGIRTVSGADVVADSSKSPAHARLLQQIPGLDLRLVRLLRDSRAVTYSWRRGAGEGRGGIVARYQALELRDGSASDGTPSPGPPHERRPGGRKLGAAGTSVRWLASNVAAGMLASNRVPSIVVKYEDLVTRPKESLTGILTLAGLPVTAEDLSFVTDDRVEIRPNHTVFGSNRLRFFSGVLPLRLDDEWRHSMRRSDRLAATAITFPLLLRHGYPLHSGRSAGSLPGRAGSEA